MTEEYVLRNRAAWDSFAKGFVELGQRAWSSVDAYWGIWGVPEREVGLLEGVDGLDAVELGCGSGYVSSWLLRRGARPVGLDNSPNQLATAKRFQEEFSVSFPLVQGDAEHAPFPDESFELVMSEYGAAIWCDPYRWIPEAARMLRPGGRLRFLGHSPLAMLCSPHGENVVPSADRLVRDQFGMHRFDWSDATDFQVPHGQIIRLLRSSGFEIEALLELQAPDGASTHADWVTLEWARRWPTDDAWMARKR